MSNVSIRRAADLTGKSPDTINRAVNNATLSHTLNRNGHKEVDVSELARVFPLVKSVDDQASAADAPCPNQPQSDTQTEVLLLKQRLVNSEEVANMIKAERDRLIGQLADKQEVIRDMQKDHCETRRLLEHKNQAAETAEELKQAQKDAEKYKRAYQVEKKKSPLQKLFGG